MTREEYAWFMSKSLRHYCVMGNDYYWTNEHRVRPDGHDGAERARCSATTRSPGSTTTATTCR